MLTAATEFPHVEHNWGVVVTNPPIKAIIHDHKREPKWRRMWVKRFSFRRNLRMAYRSMFNKEGIMSGAKLHWRIAFAFNSLFMTDTNIPDATTFDGSIVTYWLEHAHYIAAMSPEQAKLALTELAQYRVKEEELRRLLEELPEDQQMAFEKILDSSPKVNNNNTAAYDKYVKERDYDADEGVVKERLR